MKASQPLAVSETQRHSSQRSTGGLSQTLLHFEHPQRRGQAWCGAEVVGVRGRGLGPVDCVVCLDLHAR
jgi:hypothetical protein